MGDIEPIQAVIEPISTAPTHALANNYLNSGIKIYTRAKLSPPGPMKAPEYIIYQGVRYRIDDVQSWADYAKGFWVATCTLEDASDAG